MNFQEFERALTQVKDNLVVQGELLNRLDRSMIEGRQELVDSRKDFDRRINALLTIAEKHEERLNALEAAMHALFEHMDRFIRGLESDGHKGGAKE